jgi:hypothetical protein
MLISGQELLENFSTVPGWYVVVPERFTPESIR